MEKKEKKEGRKEGEKKEEERKDRKERKKGIEKKEKKEGRKEGEKKEEEKKEKEERKRGEKKEEEKKDKKVVKEEKRGNKNKEVVEGKGEEDTTNIAAFSNTTDRSHGFSFNQASGKTIVTSRPSPTPPTGARDSALIRLLVERFKQAFGRKKKKVLAPSVAAKVELNLLQILHNNLPEAAPRTMAETLEMRRPTRIFFVTDSGI
ncbi:unnamed protein product [Bursaphelenchus okinawaensis]|uniref:Uncharacterized protein n=1 Tax=Bursaphelenchus okinawaensis TaxID=465554 RepID=A0A811KNE7_9BILA|nr:unnamed protein product [Bursaphelenchus okinawaensis]CAG9108311.1 unnamed protein product [Bursaphelenchus okinawaensis]